MLEDDIPQLLPKLRPYQRRAAFWMVKREKVIEESQGERERNQFHSPLCVPVDFLDTSSKMFFNPFRLVLLTTFQIINHTDSYLLHDSCLGWLTFSLHPNYHGFILYSLMLI
jgi:E3 ubiquitin-protein ligase SHPRH